MTAPIKVQAAFDKVATFHDVLTIAGVSLAPYTKPDAALSQFVYPYPIRSFGQSVSTHRTDDQIIVLHPTQFAI